MTGLPAFIGRYKVLSRIGQGGMGVLFLAFDPMLERQVAIKLLRDDNEELRQRFAREARSVARLRHPHIVTIFDVGEQDGNPFIAMEYLHGQTLAEVIRGAAPMDVPKKLQVIEELCDGLGYAHKAGIVHRDVKPANVMIDQDGVVKVLDFGIARIAESGMTQAGMLIGTLNYMSPEQVAGQVVDGRSDIFAVGAVLYELLAYSQAFAGGLHSGILNKILHVQPQPLQETCPGLDQEVIGIVNCALQKDPANRYQDLQSMRKDLQRVRQRLEQELSGTVIVTAEDARQTAETALQVPTPRLPLTPRAVSDRDGLARRRAAQIAAHVDEARRALQSGDFDGAVVAAEQALLLNAEEPDALRILEQVRQAVDERQAKEWLARAADLLHQGQHTEARGYAEQALGLLPGSAEALALRSAIEESLARRNEARQRLDAAHAALARARDLFDRQAFEQAARAAEAALAFSPDLSGAAALRSRALDALERQRQDDQQRRVADLLAQAAALSGQERYDDAIAVLESCGLDDERIVTTLVDLRSRRAQLAARLEAEQRERDERDREVADAIARANAETSHEAALAVLQGALEIDSTRRDVIEMIESRRAALTAEREEAARAAQRQERIAAALAAAKAAPTHDAAITILREAVALDPNHLEVKQALAERVEAREREVKAAAQQAAAELARQARECEEKAAAALAEAAATPAHDAAVAILQRACTVDPEHGGLREALDARRQALALEQEQQRRARERAERIAAAIASAAAAASHEKAIATLREALALDPSNAEVRSLLESRETALEQQREQERREAEQKAKVAAAIKQAKGAKSHDAAITLLTEALAIDGSNREARSLLESRQRALDAERAEAQRAQELEASRRSIASMIAARDVGGAEAALGEAERRHGAKAFKALRRELRDARQAGAAASAQSSESPAARGKAFPPAGIVAVAAVALVLVGGGYFLTHRTAPAVATTPQEKSSPPVSSAPPASAPPVEAAPAQPATRDAAATSEPAAVSPPATVPPADLSAALERKSNAAVQLARQHLSKKDVRQAWAVVSAASSADPSNRELARVATEVVSAAREQATTARDAAAGRGEFATTTQSFTTAKRQEDEGIRQQRARRNEPALVAFLAAADLYGRADREGQQRAAAAALASQPPRPAPADTGAPAANRGNPTVPERISPPPDTAPAARPPAAPPAAEGTTPKTAPPTAPNRPPAAPAVNEEDAIRATLAAYAAAYAKLDAAAVARVYPGVNVEALRRSFAESRSFQVQIDPERIAVTGSDATVTCRVRTTFTPKAGSGSSDVRQTTFKLKKSGTQWLITSRE